MPATPFLVLPLACPHLSAPWATSPLSSQTRRPRLLFRRPSSMSVAVAEPGVRPVGHSSGPQPGTDVRLIVAGDLLPATTLGRGFGSPPGTCPYVLSHGSCLPVSSALSPSPGSSGPRQSASAFHPPLGFTPPFMFHVSVLFLIVLCLLFLGLPLSLVWSMAFLLSRCGASWGSVLGVGDSSTWLTGRVTVLRRGVGSRPVTSSILLLLRIFAVATPVSRVRLPVGRQVAPARGGGSVTSVCVHLFCLASPPPGVSRLLVSGVFSQWGYVCPVPVRLVCFPSRPRRFTSVSSSSILITRAPNPPFLPSFPQSPACSSTGQT